MAQLPTRKLVNTTTTAVSQIGDPYRRATAVADLTVWAAASKKKVGTLCGPSPGRDAAQTASSGRLSGQVCGQILCLLRAAEVAGHCSQSSLLRPGSPCGKDSQELLLRAGPTIPPRRTHLQPRHRTPADRAARCRGGTIDQEEDFALTGPGHRQGER